MATRWRNQAALETMLRDLAPALKAEVSQDLEQGSKTLATAICQAAPRRTGKLAAGVKSTRGLPPKGARMADIEADSAMVAEGLVYSVYEEEFYGPMVEGGTKRHVEQIRTAHGEREVNHPGAKPNPFWGPTYLALRQDLRNGQKAAVRRGIKKVTGS